jgi:nucleoside-triphosphatase
MRIKNLLLTGIPRIGKTTIIQSVIKKINQDCAGFFTQESKEKNQRAGFRLMTLDENDCILAHTNIKSTYRVGKYRVNLECIEKIGVTSILDGIKRKQIIIIDEIGKMELFSKKFKDAVIKALDSNCPVLGTILFRRHPFCDKIKRRKDAQIIEVTKENRNALPEKILHELLQ